MDADSLMENARSERYDRFDIKEMNEMLEAISPEELQDLLFSKLNVDFDLRDIEGMKEAVRRAIDEGKLSMEDLWYA